MTHVGPDAAPDQFGEDLGGVAEQADRHGACLSRHGLLDHRQRLVERLGRLRRDSRSAAASRCALGWHSTARQRGAGHRRRQRLRAAHAAEPGGQDPLAREVAAIVLAAHLDEGLVGALHDALRADVDPRAGRHLAVHHQALAIELVEMLPGRPVRHEVGVGDQHARRVGMGAEHADRLARLHQQGLVALQPLAASRRSGRSSPSRAPPGRCRHRPPALPAARRRRGRGCSSASAAALRSASSWPRARCRWRRG